MGVCLGIQSKSVVTVEFEAETPVCGLGQHFGESERENVKRNGIHPVMLEISDSNSLSEHEGGDVLDSGVDECSPPVFQQERVFSFQKLQICNKHNIDDFAELIDVSQDSVDAKTPDLAGRSKLPGMLAKEEVLSFLVTSENNMEHELITKFGMSKESAFQALRWYKELETVCPMYAGAPRSPSKECVLFDHFLLSIFGEIYRYRHHHKLLEYDAGMAISHNREIENAIHSISEWTEDRKQYDQLEELLTEFCASHIPPRKEEEFWDWFKLENRWKVTGKSTIEEAKAAVQSLFGYADFFLQQGPREAILARFQNWNDPESPLEELSSPEDFPNPNAGIFVKKCAETDCYLPRGQIRRCQHSDGSDLVCKVINKTLFQNHDNSLSNDYGGDFLPNEIATHRFLDCFAEHPLVNLQKGEGCPNIIGFKGVTTSPEQEFYYWMEAGAISLMDFTMGHYMGKLKEWRGMLKNSANEKRYKYERSPWASMIIRWIIHVMCAVKYMHLNGVAHRDLKLENVVLVASDSKLNQHDIIEQPEKFQAKLIDMGLSQRFGKFEGSAMIDELGTYKSPENQNRGRFPKGHDAYATDVWAIGVMIFMALARDRLIDEYCNVDPRWYCATGCSYGCDPPLSEEKKKKCNLTKLITSKKYNFTTAKKYNFTTDIINLLEEIFKPEEERITIDDIFESYFADDVQDLRNRGEISYLEPYFCELYGD